MISRSPVLVLLLTAACNANSVAPTGPLPPSEQQSTFQLPDGFEIQLVVSEPDIGQPMNLDFDAQGRLWITHSIEYPYPAKTDGVQPRSRFKGVGDHAPRDCLTVVEGINSKGQPKSIQHFVDGLNIPIGHTPMGTGDSAIVYGIPDIIHATDTNADGKADQRNTLYTGFGNQDTHGMAASFTRWIDGWIYGTHGFANTSNIVDLGGRTTSMRSGNTYRFRPDGSELQQWTWGQVNPFGMTFDPLGNLYDADCHTMPVYMLIRGAQYPHFGDKPGPLGFGPKMIDHNHGSTGICGPAYYAADHFPKDYQDCLYICNPVTGRVHRDKLKSYGSTYHCDTQTDFIRSTDPWFRPVDAIVGPDGALYIADFYNAIIGHYEVPLEHPKRDRTHGRVWRIVYKNRTNEPLAPNLTTASVPELIRKLSDPNLLVRTLATNLLVDKKAAIAIATTIDSPDTDATTLAHALWILERLDELSDKRVSRLATHDDRLVRVHLIKALAERPQWASPIAGLVRTALGDNDAFVRRAAADALGRHPSIANTKPLVNAWHSADKQDSHLIHTIRIALRDHFQVDAIAEAIGKESWSAVDVEKLQTIAVAADNDAAIGFLLRYMKPGHLDADTLKRATPAIIRTGVDEQINRIITLASATSNDARTQSELFQIITSGLAARDEDSTQHPQMIRWIDTLATRIIEELSGQASSRWVNRNVEGLSPSASPWGIRERTFADGTSRNVIDSIVNGERLTGIYHSPTFTIPKQLSFWMCGHNGRPGTNPDPVNHIRIIHQSSGKELARSVPPRHDTARRFTWDLDSHAGDQAFIEIVDAQSLDGYAWIGVGHFDPPVVALPTTVDSTTTSAILSSLTPYRLEHHADALIAITTDSKLDKAIRSAALQAATPIAKADALQSAAASIPDSQQAISTLTTLNTPTARDTVHAFLSQAHADQQQQMSLKLAETQTGTKWLLDAIRSGKASPRLLQDSAIKSRINGHDNDDFTSASNTLTQGLTPPDKRIQDIIRNRLESYPTSNASAAQGKRVFTQHCAVCHRIGQEGGLIGPQLDGIGNRGLARILEDILDPNRNVDLAFRLTVITRSDNTVTTGLKRRSTYQATTFADIQGNEFTIANRDIKKTESMGLSLMPPTLADSIKPKEFNDLIAYLMEQRVK